MNSESGKSYMDKLKARNIPPQVQAEMQMEEETPTVQISVAEWDELIASVNRLEELSAELKAQKAAFAAEAGQICLSGGTIELILSEKRKAAKKDGRVYAKK